MILTNTTGIDLQATLSASTAGGPGPVDGKHHPITCPEDLEFGEDGLRCPHALRAALGGLASACSCNVSCNETAWNGPFWRDGLDGTPALTCPNRRDQPAWTDGS